MIEVWVYRLFVVPLQSEQLRRLYHAPNEIGNSSYRTSPEFIFTTISFVLSTSKISFSSPFNFFLQLSNFHRHFRQAESEIETFLIGRADKNRRKRPLQQLCDSPASIALSHQAHLTRAAIGI